MLMFNQKEYKKIRRLLQSAKINLPFNVVFHPEAANEHTSLQAQRRCIQSSRDHAGGKAIVFCMVIRYTSIKCSGLFWRYFYEA